MNRRLPSVQILLLACSLCVFMAQPFVSLAAESSPSPKANAGTLLGVIEKGTLRVGVSLFTPWALKTKDGQLIGFEIDVAKQLANDLRVQPEFHVFDWDKILPALLNREIDIIVAGMTITPQRALKVNFSQPYATSGISLATNMALTKNFGGPNDLNKPEVTITAVTGTVSEDLARRMFPKATIKTFATSYEAMQAVTTGKVHGYIEHEPIPTFIAIDHPTTVDEPLSQPLLTTKSGFAINKGDPDFINFLNAWVISHEADVWLSSSNKYWFESVEWRKDVKDTQ